VLYLAFGRNKLDWRIYQEETAKVFRSLGCKALVEEKLEGARGEHDIDVLVTFKKFGVPSKWVVECKYWDSAVTKEKVLALQAIVDDVGADRGILVSKTGFQSGAIKQALKSNITLTSLDDFAQNATDDFLKMQRESTEVKLIKACRIYSNLTEPSEEYSFGFLEYDFDGFDGQKAMVFNYYLIQAHKSLQDLKLGTKKYKTFVISDYSSLNMNYSPIEEIITDEDMLVKYIQELVYEALNWAKIKLVIPSI
jgi:hypothetical protein